jgi:3-deoxy-D-manno-octulosonate cytidylyltransferase
MDERVEVGDGVLVVIPARMGSERLPGKALVDLGGRPMILRVVDAVARAKRVDAVVVATDDQRILDVVVQAGAQAVRTRADHSSGTDRVAEVASTGSAALIINVQGDEPLVDPSSIDRLVAAFDDPSVEVATLAAPLSGDPSTPSRVKVVLDLRGRALYFSRAPVPTGGPFLHHIGLYGFRPAALRLFAETPPGPLEQSERLEQLRFLENGIAIQVVLVEHAHPSVDTPADLLEVRRHFIHPE